MIGKNQNRARSSANEETPARQASQPAQHENQNSRVDKSKGRQQKVESHDTKNLTDLGKRGLRDYPLL
jgi:hypothetical protein